MILPTDVLTVQPFVKLTSKIAVPTSTGAEAHCFWRLNVGPTGPLFHGREYSNHGNGLGSGRVERIP
jgi:hypothetical protein